MNIAKGVVVTMFFSSSCCYLLFCVSEHPHFTLLLSNASFHKYWWNPERGRHSWLSQSGPHSTTATV